MSLQHLDIWTQKKGVIVEADHDEVKGYMDLFFDLGVRTITLSDLQGVADEGKTARSPLFAFFPPKRGRTHTTLNLEPFVTLSG
jgi:hypothetical protein